MRRRALLSTGMTALVATAGCFGSGCSSGTSFDLTAVSAADAATAASDALDDLSPPERDAAVAARRGEAATIWAAESNSRPFAITSYVAADRAYYTVETSVRSTVERTGYRVTLDAGPDVDTSGDSIALDDLSPTDRLALYGRLGFPNASEMEKMSHARSIRSSGILAYPSDEAESESVLVPDSAYDVLRIGSTDFRFRIVERQPVTVETRRVDLSQVAPSTDAFAAHLFEQFGIDLDERNLSAEQRDIVETAIADYYDECAPYSDAYADLQTTLGGTNVDEGDDRIDYANYENEWYELSLMEYAA